MLSWQASARREWLTRKHKWTQRSPPPCALVHSFRRTFFFPANQTTNSPWQIVFLRQVRRTRRVRDFFFDRDSEQTSGKKNRTKEKTTSFIKLHSFFFASRVILVVVLIAVIFCDQNQPNIKKKKRRSWKGKSKPPRYMVKSHFQSCFKIII